MTFERRSTNGSSTHSGSSTTVAAPGKRTLTEALAPVQARSTRDLVQRAVVATEQPAARDEAAIHAAADRGTATGSSALPHSDTLQRAFGRHDISSIKAHVGSEASATADAMGARAYATGDHVVLGQGADLFTVAHEAAHVVQQRGGVQLKGGVGETGDLYEQHADEVASLVVQGKSAEHVLDRHAAGAPGAAAIQRAPMPYHNQNSQDPAFTRNRDAVATVATKIDGAVARARTMSLDWRNLLDHSAPHVKRWAQTAKAYFENPRQAPDFIHAQFGYSIETLACAELGSQESGLVVGLQIARGATRPDIVLSEGQTEVAWIDITSRDSAGHIFGKDHSGWKTKPFVYEILYEPLDLQQVMTGTADPVYAAVGGYMAKQNQIRYEEETTATNSLRTNLVGLRDGQGWETGTGDAKKKQRDTRDMLNAQPLNMGLGASLKGTAGALSVAGVYDGPFGFNRNHPGTDSGPAKAWVKAQAQPNIDHRLGELETSEIQRIRAELQPAAGIPLVASLLHALQAAPSTELVHQAVAVSAAVRVLGELRGAAARLQRDAKDPRAAGLLHQVNVHYLAFPMEANFTHVQAWALHAMKLTKECRGMRELLDSEKHAPPSLFGPGHDPGHPPTGGPSMGGPPMDMPTAQSSQPTAMDLEG